MAAKTVNNLPAARSIVGVSDHATPQRRFRPDIQGLRGVAIILVLAYHSGIPWVTGGYVGVDVFFVISGFLISLHLFESLTASNRVSFMRFYANRARRILPASLAVISLTTVATLLWVPPLHWADILRSALMATVFIPNVDLAMEGTNYLVDPTPSFYQHYWSLGVEEQFYLIAPLLLFVAYRTVRGSSRHLFAVTAAATLASFVLCQVASERVPSWTFFSMPTRAWEFGVGALVALAVQNRFEISAASGRLLGVAGSVLVVAPALLLDEATQYPGAYTLLPVLGAAALIMAGLQGGPGLRTWLTWRPLRAIGLISFSLYLVHWPLQLLPEAMAYSEDPLPINMRLLLGLASIPIAAALYYLVERPALRRGRNAGPHGRTLLTTLLIVSILGGFLAAGARASNSMRLDASTPTAEAAQPLGGDWTGGVPSNLDPTLRDAAEDNPGIYRNDCHRSNKDVRAEPCLVGTNTRAPLIALIGDSHAANWYPAFAELARRGDIRLAAYTKSSCPAAKVDVILGTGFYSDCTNWRESVFEHVNATKPAVAVLAGYTGGVEIRPANGAERAGWTAGWENSVRKLTGPSRVVILADTPNVGISPAACLSDHLHNTRPCAQERDHARVEYIQLAERDAARSGRGEYIDLIDHFCNDSICPLVIGHRLVYRDSHHITATFSQSLAGVVSRTLQLAPNT